MIYLLSFLFFLFFLFFLLIIANICFYKNKEGFTENETELVIARYNEDLEWIKNEPFNKYKYTVYNKGPNENYVKTEKFKKEFKLDNVGRETHSYLTHIINNYDNKSFADITIFIPGSIELENRYERSKRLFEKIPLLEKTDLFSCMYYNNEPVVQHCKDFSIDKYLSSNNNNRSINTDDSMFLEEIRPYSKWYNHLFNDNNIESKCFTQNSMFGITKETILKKPKSYYESLISRVNKHHNHEAVHYFERSWETVFYPFDKVLHVL
jgi:hypothetical protein